MRSVALVLIVILSGCASAHNPADPLEPINRGIYSFNDAADRHVIKPIVKGYVKVMPLTGQIMVSNFFSNLDDAMVTINDVLQLKLTQGFSDGMRFVVNTTIGVFGLIDVASKGGLEKHDEDFGQTLGHWGVGSGPYIVIPIFGPSSARDGIGLFTDEHFDPTTPSDVELRNELDVVKGVDKRSKLLGTGEIIDQAAIDPYMMVRDAYLLHRDVLINGPKKINYDDNLKSGL